MVEAEKLAGAAPVKTKGEKGHMYLCRGSLFNGGLNSKVIPRLASRLHRLRKIAPDPKDV